MTQHDALIGHVTLLAEEQCASIGRRLGIELQRDDVQLTVTSLTVNGIFERTVPQEWYRHDVRTDRLEMNELFLLWHGDLGEWVAFHLGTAMNAAARFDEARAHPEDPAHFEAHHLGTVPEKDIYLFFVEANGTASKLKLCQPAAMQFFGDDLAFWPQGYRDSYKRTVTGEETDRAIKTDVRIPHLTETRTLTSDLLFRMYEIACCNDPKQPLLRDVEKHLLEYGYDIFNS